MNDIFRELSLVVVIVAMVSIVMQLLRQPLIIGYILAGIFVGPLALNAVHSEDTLSGLASFGIALLLYIIGLGLNPHVIREVGRVAVFTGVGQVGFTIGIGWLMTIILGYDARTAIYIAVALAFSSTIIVLKLLSDKQEQNRLYGKISIGFLLVQDILATVALIMASAAGNGSLAPGDIAVLLAKGVGLVAALTLIVWLLLPRLKLFLSSSQELLFVFAIAWGLGIASVFREVGFSLEVGALAAGIALATQPFAMEIGSRLRPLRDFFIVLFFVSLGTHIDLQGVSQLLPEAVILSAFVLLGNPLVVMIIMGMLGYTRKTSFKAGLAVAQISEFSLVFILLGNRLGQVDDQVVSLVTLVGLITIALSSYMIIYAEHLYLFLERYLKIFERKQPRSENEHHTHAELLLIGYKKGGEQFVKVFRNMKRRYLVLDYDPFVVEKLQQEHVNHAYGDVTDVELLEELNVSKARLIISTLSDFGTNAFLAGYLARNNPLAVVICSADTPEQAAELYAEGVDYVMMPHYIGNERIANFIKRSGLNRGAFAHFKSTHLAQVKAEIEKHQQGSKKNKRRHLGRTILRNLPDTKLSKG